MLPVPNIDLLFSGIFNELEMSNQAEDFACKFLRVSCLYGLATKNPEVFFEIFWWRKSVDNKDFELGEAGKTLGTQKYKLQRRNGKMWGPGSKVSHVCI